MHKNDLRYLRFLKRFRDKALPTSSQIGRLIFLDAISEDVSDGGPGSGNWGHRGRPGQVGGSGKGGGSQYRGGRSDVKYHSSKHDWLNGLQGEEQHTVTSWLKAKQHEYPIDPDNKKPIEQRILEQGSSTDKENLLHFMGRARKFDQYSDRLIDEHLDDKDKRLLQILGEKYGVDPKTNLPDDFDTAGWDKEDRDYWFDLKSKAMGGPDTGREAPDELQYIAGFKERPKPKVNLEWWEKTDPYQRAGTEFSLKQASGMNDINFATGEGVLEAEQKAFENAYNGKGDYLSYKAQRDLSEYISDKWNAYERGAFDPKVRERLTPEEFAQLQKLEAKAHLRGDKSPAETLDYESPVERMEGFALINKALGGADMTEYTAKRAEEIRAQEAEQRRQEEERRQRLQEQQQQREAEAERRKQEEERKKQEELDRGITTAIKSAEINHVESLQPQKYESQPTSNEIVSRLGGADRTRGSCASLALAYAGNQMGFDVLDFRDGESRSIFAKKSTMEELAKSPGVNGTIIPGRNKSELVTAAEALSKMEKGKEYILSTGEHASVVRRNDLGEYEYLELQSTPDRNGYRLFDGKNGANTLRHRFGCKKSRSSYGTHYESNAVLVEIGRLKGCKGFENALQYINTKADKQRKGAGGGVK